jgi:hypothetical protein
MYTAPGIGCRSTVRIPGIPSSNTARARRSTAAQKALERIRAHLVDPGLLLMDLYIPAEAAHPPGAPVVQVQTLTLPDGSKIARRAEVFVDIEGRRIDIKSRYEQRERATITAREDETLAVTWYSEDEITALLRNAGYRDVATGAPALVVDDATPANAGRAAGHI